MKPDKMDSLFEKLIKQIEAEMPEEGILVESTDENMLEV